MLDMPIRLMVALVVGGAAIAIGLNYVYNQEGAINKYLKLENFHPEIVYTDKVNTIYFKVVDQSNMPVKDATVIIIPEYRGGKSANGITDGKGEVNINIKPELSKNEYEGYLTVHIIANGYPDYEARNLIKVVRE